jgi:D-alanyl-D-alanine carboxypeptidase (penicillin-binding protein 5/6)
MNRYLQVFFLVLLFGFLGVWFVNASQKTMTKLYYAQIINSVERRNVLNTQKPIHLDINSEAAICKKIDRFGNKESIFEKEANKGLPIASLTKLMTSIIILENYDLNEEVVVSPIAANQQNAYWGGNLVAGEKKTIGELFELMLVFSSNDAAYSIAEQIGLRNFTQKMNQKAQELNLENTHFINPSGLDPITDEIPNYSTTEDLVKITEYVLKNHPSVFQTSLKSIAHKLNASLSSLKLKEKQRLIGGKTGFTFKAGGCLLTVLENNKNETFINIVLGTKSYNERIEEMQKIINIIQ